MRPIRLARLGGWLRAAGLELDERHILAGDALPVTLDGYDGMVVLGGPQSAMDDDTTSPELVGVRELLRQALAADFPTLAICLGAQLLAQVGGGRVRTGIDGPEVGALLVAKRDVADADPLFKPLPLTPDVLQFHHDEISELPTGATLLASSPMYANQAFRVGPTSTESSSTSRRHRRSSTSGRSVTSKASPPARTTARRSASSPTRPTRTSRRSGAPFAGRFADLVRSRARQAA